MQLQYSTKFSKELQEQLAFEEGIKHHAYLDSKRIRTIGIGHNLVAMPLWRDSGIPIGDSLTEQEITRLLVLDLVHTENELVRKWVGYISVPRGPRRDVVLAMAFQLGVAGFMQFVKLRAMLERGYWDMAAEAALNSKWAKEDSPARAARVASQIATGEYYAIPLN